MLPCGHCSFQIERSEACTELKHCNISICSLCGYKAAPGEKTINTDHWKTCFRYEDELLEFVGARRHDTHYLHSLRRALHMVRFFEQLSDHNRVEASVYLHELLESSEFVEDKFANAKDFQFGCFLRRARRSAGCFPMALSRNRATMVTVTRSYTSARRVCTARNQARGHRILARRATASNGCRWTSAAHASWAACRRRAPRALTR